MNIQSTTPTLTSGKHRITARHSQKIGIIYNSFGGKEMLPEEKEMRDTGLTIGKTLEHMGYRVKYFDMDDSKSIARLCASHIDVAFDACERIHGNSRGEAYAAGLLEFLGIPHTRTSSWLISLGISKERVKAILSYYGIPTPKYQIYRDINDPLRSDLKFPLFIKGLSSENSIGIDNQSLVTNQAQLKNKVDQILRDLHQPALVEEYIDGRELTVAILPGNPDRVLPISEIIFKDLPPERHFLDYSAKWFTETEQYRKTIPICPAPLTEEERVGVETIALRCFHILGLNSYARIDVRYREKTPFVLEVNQNPSIGEQGSGYVRTCQGVGIDYPTMIETLMKNAMMRKHESRRS